MFYRDGHSCRDGRPERTPKLNKPQNKPVNARKKESRVFIQDESKRAKKRQINALKRKPQTKARKQNAKRQEKQRRAAPSVPKTDETAQARQNGRKTHAVKLFP